MKRAIGVVAALVATASLCWAMGAVQWQPGFPMRAGSQVLLMWQPYPGAERYEVVRTDLDTKTEHKATVTVPQYVDAAASPERSYVYTVRALLPGGMPAGFSEPRKLEGFKPLGAPKWVGHYQQAGAVHLAWEAVAGAAFYNLYRAPEGAQPALLASVQDTSYVDAAAESGVTYRYTLRAVGLQSQESPSAEELTVTIGAGGVGVSRVEKLVRHTARLETAISAGDPYRLREPTDCAAWDRGVLVSDLGSRSVLLLEPDGDLAVQFAMRPPDYQGAWGIPWGIGADPERRRVALTFLRTPAVRVFGADWALARDLVLANPPGYEEDPRVPQPMDVAPDGAGGLWVSDYTFAQLVHLDAQGRELGRVGTPRGEEGFGPFRSPTFLAYDAAGERLFAVDSLLATVFVIGADGEILTHWKRAEMPEGSLDLPKGIALDRDGNLLVVDGIRSSLQTFTPEGQIRAVYYSPDLPFLNLRGLVTATQDPRTGDLYAVSKVDSTVYRLVVSGE